MAKHRVQKTKPEQQEEKQSAEQPQSKLLKAALKPTRTKKKDDGADQGASGG